SKTGLLVGDGGSEDTPEDTYSQREGATMPWPCIEAKPGMQTLATLAVPARFGMIDVLFLIDASASMQDEIEGVRLGLRERIVPETRALIANPAFGVALFGEFPVLPHAHPSSGVEPYRLRVPMTTDIRRVEVALQSTPVWGNLDDPEASVEALYQVATGEGFPPFIPPSPGCPMEGWGGVCFREGALRVILLITDAPMHNGPPGVQPESRYTFTPSPHTYEEALSKLREIGARVIGLGSSDLFHLSPFPHLRAIAKDTGAVDANGNPMVFDIGDSGNRIESAIVQAITSLAQKALLNVDAVVEDVPGDLIDARELIKEVRPLEAQPSSGVQGIVDNAFIGVLPNTILIFELVIDGGKLSPHPERRMIPARVVFRENKRIRMDERVVWIVIPGLDGGC
ncbi:MAG: hypothetical protein NZM37_08545, partial [Sandaracinaceae bacterium]|nr:hypothetical protein [Sandaracinaceae bacterium]